MKIYLFTHERNVFVMSCHIMKKFHSLQYVMLIKIFHCHNKCETSLELLLSNFIKDSFSQHIEHKPTMKSHKHNPLLQCIKQKMQMKLVENWDVMIR